MEIIKNVIFSTPLLRVLDVLLQHSNQELNDTEIIQKVTGAKRAAIHRALQKLADFHITERVHKGRRCYNQIDLDNTWLVPFKIALNILEISPLVNRIKKLSIKIILFGSRSQGTNCHDSDFDLLIISSKKDLIIREINRVDESHRIQPIIKTPEEILNVEKNDPVFFKEVHRGVIVWEK